MENLNTIINNLYKNELALAKQEFREPFYILVGYELTKGLLKSIEMNSDQRASFTSILDFYKMDTQELYGYVKSKEPSNPDLFSIVVLSLETLKKVQDYNIKLFVLNNLVTEEINVIEKDC